MDNYLKTIGQFEIFQRLEDRLKFNIVKQFKNLQTFDFNKDLNLLNNIILNQVSRRRRILQDEIESGQRLIKEIQRKKEKLEQDLNDVIYFEDCVNEIDICKSFQDMQIK